MKKRFFFFIFSVAFFCFQSLAQKERVKIKFGDVKPEDFSPTAYSVDSSADAVYLFNGGNASFQGNNNGYFNVVYTRHTRIRLLHKNSFNDLATVEIPIILTSDYKQNLEGFQAATYNIENGKVTVTKADKSALLKENAVKTNNGTEVVNKFTFSNIKEGSIIEYTYTINYPGYYYIPTWYFQKDYPVLYSEYEITVPEFYDYVLLKHGLYPYAIDTAKTSSDNYIIADEVGGAIGRMETFAVSANTINSLWAIKDLPAIKKEEKFITSVENYTSRIEFQLSSIRYPNQPVIQKMNNWMKEAADLMQAEYFGIDLYKGNNWLDDDLKKITSGATDETEKAKKIYEYVRDNFSCTDYDAWRLSQPIKKTYQTKKGNVADINMLLTAMLKNRGFTAQPAILSTRDNGKCDELYPLMDQYNYLICHVEINDQPYLLDAANNNLGFGHLSDECYNGSARIIDTLPFVIPLSADSLKENKVTTVFIINTDSGMDGAFSSNLGYFESLNMRNKLKTEKENDFFNAIKKSYSFDVNISNPSLDSLSIPENPVSVKYNMHFDFNDDDIIYFNPILTEAYKENPFKSADRFYPVEMPYCTDETYVLNMEVPKGYAVDELPKSARVKLNEADGMFEYLIAASGNNIQLRCRLQLNKANFDSEDYQTLRDFFGYVVKKQAEQIVFKKIK